VCCCCCWSDCWCFAGINVAIGGAANRAVVNPESAVEIIRLKEAGNCDGPFQRDHDVGCLR